MPLGVGPMNSKARVEAGTLHVKMGWAFNADIPLTSITSMKAITRAEAKSARIYALGVHVWGDRWLVNASLDGLVALTIEPAVQATAWRKSVPLKELWVSVADPDVLIAACTAN
ncbi:hypothetical protein [Mycobacterium sp. Aquia_213]|uniref:hypothetical protein n=1 Tax=Mycobacterium sp. Aquia_213 TaxID=2991728 RepID=UPI00226F8B78|nr:hypothetical protein [Mycobacterium sp. Aquia_213]WAC89699.1 hypothetical protein LMQ14_17250 [Mycobacterium sp. Aquia_213]